MLQVASTFPGSLHKHKRPLAPFYINMTRLKVESTMCKAECKMKWPASVCVWWKKSASEMFLLEHLVVGSEAFEETKIHAYESPGNPQHVGMMASKKPNLRKPCRRNWSTSLIRKRKLSKCTPSDKSKTSGIIRSQFHLRKQINLDLKTLLNGINGAKFWIVVCVS